MIILETQRLIIREWTASTEDKNAFYEILSSPITMSFWPRPYTYEQTESWIDNNIKRYKESGFGRWAVVLKKNNKIIGDCGIAKTQIDRKYEYDLGYIVHYPYWQKGLAGEAAKACLDYGFNELQLKRLCANMPYDHTGSVKTAEKIGMSKEKEFFNSKNRNILTYLYSKNI